MKTRLAGINIELLTNIMSIYGIKYIAKKDDFNCWSEKDKNYGTISCFCDLSQHLIVEKIYDYLLNMVNDANSGKYTPNLKTFIRNGKNLFIPPSRSGKKDQVKTILSIFSTSPTKEYVEQTLFNYPYIQHDKNLSPITFAEENQRQDYKFGLKATNFSGTINCNRVIQMLMWIGIENYLDFHEVDNFSDIINMGEYIVNNEYKENSKGRAIILCVPILGKYGEPIYTKKYERGPKEKSSYFYWVER